MNWVLSSIIAMISFALMTLTFKKIADLGVQSKIINVYVFGIVFLMFLSFNFITKTNVKIDSNIILLLVVASIFSFIGNYLVWGIIGKAPNPGFVVAITGLQGIFVTLASLVLFKSQVTLLKLFGVVLAAISILLISI